MAHPTERYQLAVIGGGMVGAAIAAGAAARGARVVLLDEGDVAMRAARCNFGLVWSQSKGDGMPAYAAWTKRSIDLWPDFAERMSSLAGRDVQYRRRGGVTFCLDDKEFETRAGFVQRMHNQGVQGLRMVDRAELLDLMGGAPLGAEVMSASYHPEDGHVDPLMLLRGMHAALHRDGGVHSAGAKVTTIDPVAAGFRLTREDGSQVEAARIVIAAGIGIPALARQVGLDVPVRPVRGQNMVTEKLSPILPLPASALRQTGDGTIQIGVTTEDDGRVEVPTTTDALSRMAARAVRVLPALAGVRIVRSWAGLRPMTPDGFPAYAESKSHPGAFVAVCHSGVTLAAVHADVLAAAMLTGGMPEHAAELHPDRFDGQTDVQAH
jgi:glycine/D-amino acid oxidase-like deaminating enzyme